MATRKSVARQCDKRIFQHGAVTMEKMLEQNIEQALAGHRDRQQNDQNSDGQVQPCVALRRKTALQKLSLFLEPLVAHSPIQPFSLRRKRIASCCRLDRKPLMMRRARLRSRFRSPLFAQAAGGGDRTHTILRSLDFESSASASSATPARRNQATKEKPKLKRE